MDSPLGWLVLTFLCITLQSLFAMLEMASVSFNKMRLQYYVTKGNRRAQMLASLLQNPSRLFGTTLLVVNFALQVGSECSRRYYGSMGINPNWAPLTQVFLVLIFAELSPLFAARNYAENVIMLGMPLLYGASILFIPITWSIGILSKGVNYLFTGKKQVELMQMTRDELQRALEEQGTLSGPTEEDVLAQLVPNLFALQKKMAKHVMIPLHQVDMIPHSYTIEQAKKIMARTTHSHLPLYQEDRMHITGIIRCANLLKKQPLTPLSTLATSPWFVTLNTKISLILNQFRFNNQKLAIVLDNHGQSVGILTLDDILKEIFGNTLLEPHTEEEGGETIIDRTLPADMSIAQFNEQFGTHLNEELYKNLAQLLSKTLGRKPDLHDMIQVEGFEFEVVEVGLYEIKSLKVRTLL